MSWDTESCRYCGNSYHRKNISTHEDICSSNPANQED